jgi:hypothetical protein
MSFWPREKLQEKVACMVHVAKSCGLTPGAAAKLYGVVNFFETGMFGRVGRAGLIPIKERQYQEGREITAQLQGSFDLLEGLLQMKPRREYTLFSRSVSRFVVASDAAYEDGRGTAGFLIVLDPATPEESRYGVVVEIPAGLYPRWGDMGTYISQLELLMGAAALLVFAPRLRGRIGVWFIDNVPALMALVGGGSRVPSLDEISLLVHPGMFALKAQAFYEWVASEANWSDGISRKGVEEEWAGRHAF